MFMHLVYLPSPFTDWWLLFFQNLSIIMVRKNNLGYRYSSPRLLFPIHWTLNTPTSSLVRLFRWLKDPLWGSWLTLEQWIYLPYSVYHACHLAKSSMERERYFSWFGHKPLAAVSIPLTSEAICIVRFSFAGSPSPIANGWVGLASGYAYFALLFEMDISYLLNNTKLFVLYSWNGNRFYILYILLIILQNEGFRQLRTHQFIGIKQRKNSPWNFYFAFFSCFSSILCKLFPAIPL